MKKIPISKGRKEPASREFWTKDIPEKWTGNVAMCLDAETVVLDVDVRHGGLETLARIKDLIPKTYTVKTPTGGLHYYFIKAKDVELRKNSELQGIDIKTGPRSYVLCPPSEIDGKFYTILEKAPIQKLSKELEDLFSAKIEATEVASDFWSVAKVKFYLDQLDPTDFKDQDAWYQVLCATHEATDGDKHALSEFISWSRGDAAYDTNENEKSIINRWTSLRVKAGGITRASLVRLCAKKDYAPDFDGIDRLELDDALAKIKTVRDEVLYEQLLRKVKEKHDVSLGVLRKATKKTAKEIKRSLFDFAKDLSKQYRSRLVYSTVDEMFWIYKGQIWHPIHERLVEQLALKIATKPKYLKRYTIGAFGTAAKNLVDLAKTMLASDINFWQKSQEDNRVFIPTADGILTSQGLQGYRRDAYLISKFNFSYRPDGNTSEFDKFLCGLFEDKDTHKFIYEFIGYCLLSRKTIPLVLVCHGEGKNGKTTLARLLSHWIGYDKVAPIDLEQLDKDKHSYANLTGKYLAIDDDVNKSARLPDGTLKKLSESKILEANPKGKPAFLFVNTAALMLLTNHILHSWDLSHGMRRRLMLLPFEKTIENPDLTIFEKLSADLELRDAVFSRGADFAFKVLARGCFSIPESLQKRTSKWLDELDYTAIFIKDSIAQGSKDVKLSILFEQYKEACQEDGLSAISAMRFREQIVSSGYKVEQRGSRQYFILNVKLL